MNENSELRVDTIKKTVADLGVRAKESLSAKVREEPAKTFSILFVATILISVVFGYRLSRMEEESRRHHVVEDWMREVTNWIKQNGGKIATPIKGSLESSKSAVEDISNATARQWLPFFEKQKRSFFNLF